MFDKCSELRRRATPPPALPAVVGESLVGLRHLVDIFLALDGCARVVGGIEDLVGETLTHRRLLTTPGVVDQPSHRQGVLTARWNLHGNLVRRSADPA